MKKRTRIKAKKSALKGKRLFTDFGGLGYYRVLKYYQWKEYCENAENLDGTHWFGRSMVKIKTESGVTMKMPFIELGLRSVYADSGESVLTL